MHDIVVAGQEVRAGDVITLWVTPANRDESPFPDRRRNHSNFTTGLASPDALLAG